MSKIVIVGGSGKIAKLFSRLATSKTGAQITSLVRSRDHFDAMSQTGATPQLLDIESAKVEELQQAFEGAQGVLFAAGAGGKGPKERTRKVDEEGAIKASSGISRERPKTRGRETKSGTGTQSAGDAITAGSNVRAGLTLTRPNLSHIGL